MIPYIKPRHDVSRVLRYYIVGTTSRLGFEAMCMQNQDIAESWWTAKMRFGYVLIVMFSAGYGPEWMRVSIKTLNIPSRALSSGKVTVETPSGPGHRCRNAIAVMLLKCPQIHCRN